MEKKVRKEETKAEKGKNRMRNEKVYVRSTEINKGIEEEREKISDPPLKKKNTTANTHK